MTNPTCAPTTPPVKDLAFEMRRQWFVMLESIMDAYMESCTPDDTPEPVTVVLKSGHTFTGFPCGLTGTYTAQFADEFGHYKPGWQVDLGEVAAIREPRI